MAEPDRAARTRRQSSAQPWASLGSPATTSLPQAGALEEAAPSNVIEQGDGALDNDGEESEDETEAATSDRREQVRRASKLVGQGHSFRRKGLLGAARTRYQQALAAYSGYPRALAGLTQVALAKKEASEALRHARSLVRARPNEGAYQLLLGDAYALAGDREKARAAWRVAHGLGNRTARARLM